MSNLEPLIIDKIYKAIQFAYADAQHTEIEHRLMLDWLLPKTEIELSGVIGPNLARELRAAKEELKSPDCEFERVNWPQGMHWSCKTHVALYSDQPVPNACYNQVVMPGLRKPPTQTEPFMGTYWSPLPPVTEDSATHRPFKYKDGSMLECSYILKGGRYLCAVHTLKPSHWGPENGANRPCMHVEPFGSGEEWKP